MQRNESLKAILIDTRAIWDRPDFRSVARLEFNRVLKCRTEALGSEVYASSTEQKIIHHTCKSRSCTSCGHRATKIWQREQWASLHDIEYTGIVFTMPDVLWPIFQETRHLLRELPSLGAEAIKQWAKETYGVSLMILCIPHTFGRHITFNPHLHILVSSGGLRVADNKWITRVNFVKDALMRRWRYWLITFLRQALASGSLRTILSTQAMKQLLKTQYERWWSVHVQSAYSKEHFLKYVGRYLRRPPLAQYRILSHDDREISFRTMDHKLKREVITRYSPVDFIHHLSEHVRDRYQHSIGYFGLLAPRSKHQTSGAICAQLRQPKRPRPVRLSFDLAIENEFGTNPLIDSRGEGMRLVSRRPPSVERLT